MPRLEQLHPGVDRALLKQVGAVAHERGKRADVELVGLDRRVGDQLAAEEAGHDDRDVPLVGTGHVRIVDHDHVAVLQTLPGRVMLEYRLDAVTEAAGEHRQRLDLGEHSEPAVVQRAATVEDVVDDRRERGALQRHEHLIGRCVEAVADDRRRHRIHGRSAIELSRLSGRVHIPLLSAIST